MLWSASGGDIEITRTDNSKAIFKVDKLEQYPQDNFPTQLVYGKTEQASLRIITCAGKYSQELQRYSHNLVVYATLVNIVPKSS